MLAIKIFTFIILSLLAGATSMAVFGFILWVIVLIASAFDD